MSNPKTYKCKYCNYRSNKDKLIPHIQDEHEDLIPEGYTAARIVFNIINKKEHGNCMVDRKQTEWDEQAYRYKTFCSEKCRQYYKINIIDKRMINKYGTPTLLNDEQHQKKMLQNRRISGNYKFSDGGVKSYTGSYEKKLLEFMDSDAMKISSDDIETPGLTISYEFNGEEHMWILDLYYIPFNLLIDVKDGGDNKNNNPALEEYREKQIAKEKAITKLGKYNYLRLTNNDFSQLLLTMNQIKFNMRDNQLMPIININESSTKINNLYFITYSENENSIDGYCISKDESLEESYIVNLETNKIEKKDFEFFRDKEYIVYEFRDDLDCNKLFDSLSGDITNGELVSFDYPYKKITNNRLYLPEQIIVDNRFNNIYYSSKNDTSTILERYEEMVEYVVRNNTENELNIEETLLFPILNESLKLYKNLLLDEYINIDIVEGVNGYYIINNEVGTMSKSFKYIYDIQLENIEFMNEIRV